MPRLRCTKGRGAARHGKPYRETDVDALSRNATSAQWRTMCLEEAARVRVDVRPALLRWARERAELDADMLIPRFPKLHAWESGEARPTLRQLESFAAATHTPIGYLFLPAPPTERIPIPDLRTVAHRRRERPSPDLLDTLYLCQQRQDWYRDFARTTGERALAFVGSARPTDQVAETAARIRRALGFDIEERRQLRTWTDALRRFIGQADALGILVMVSGVVGSNNRRKLDPQEFRGFALSDDLAPLVFVNGADTKAAQMFTLAHEIAHIWLGQSAISEADPSETSSHNIERWADQVAAELLVPIDIFERDYEPGASLGANLDRLARRFKVSSLVILRRMRDVGALEGDDYWAAYQAESERLQALPRGSGGDFYLTLGARASKRFARALVMSTLEGRSSFTEAFRLLGFKKMTTFRELGQNLGLMV